MPKKTSLLIFVLAAVTGILAYLAFTNQSFRPSSTQQPTPTKKSVEKTAKVFFSPQNLDLSSGIQNGVSTVDIMVDTGNAEIAGVQIELQFDPKALSKVILSPTVDSTGFFGGNSTVLFNDVKQDAGRISYAVAISPGQNPINGIGKIATLSFQKAFGAPPSTTINFLNKTLVTMLGENESVLKESLPLNVIFSTSTSPFAPPVTLPPE